MATGDRSLPRITHVLETCLYVRDKQESLEFYRDILGLDPQIDSPRVTGFPVGNTLLLLFTLGLTGENINTESGGLIPNHGPSQQILELLSQNGKSSAEPGPLLKQHFCLAVETPAEVRKFEQRLGEKGARILGTNDWELGGRSVYFADPDGHIGEVGSRGIWPTY